MARRGVGSTIWLGSTGGGSSSGTGQHGENRGDEIVNLSPSVLVKSPSQKRQHMELAEWKKNGGPS